MARDLGSEASASNAPRNQGPQPEAFSCVHFRSSGGRVERKLSPSTVKKCRASSRVRSEVEGLTLRSPR
eukprot:3136496-Rhodomonas_salina.3